MILDFLKKHWILAYSVLGADLLSILLVKNIYLHESIKLEFLTFFLATVFLGDSVASVS